MARASPPTLSQACPVGMPSQPCVNNSRGSCGICHGVFRLTLDGKLYGHGGKAKDSKCPGSNSLPGAAVPLVSSQPASAHISGLAASSSGSSPAPAGQSFNPLQNLWSVLREHAGPTMDPTMVQPWISLRGPGLSVATVLLGSLGR